MTDTELVELAATRVMGWHKHSVGCCGGVGDSCDYWFTNKRCLGQHKLMKCKDWNPLTSLDDAWDLVKKMCEPKGGGPDCLELYTKFLMHMGKNRNSQIYTMTAEQFARKIVMAALEAAGV